MSRSSGICRGDLKRCRTSPSRSDMSSANIVRSTRGQRPSRSLAKRFGVTFIVATFIFSAFKLFHPLYIAGVQFKPAVAAQFAVTLRNAYSVAAQEKSKHFGNSDIIPLAVKREEFTDQSLERGVKKVKRDVSYTFQNIHGSPLYPDSDELKFATGIKIFAYDLPQKYNLDWLVDPRCSTHLFGAEVAIHEALISSSVVTTDPEEADFFFLPVYLSCNFSTRNGFPFLENAPAILRSAVDLVSQEMKYWNRSGGRDHIMVATHDFGACFHALEGQAVAAGIPKFMRNSIILQTFGRKDLHPCQKSDVIQIPPYISPAAVRNYWARPEIQNRSIWVQFRGKLELHPKSVSGSLYSKGVRTKLWRRFSHDKRFFIKRKKHHDYYSEMLRSVFCLCPLGWAPWSPRVVEAVVFGCVPVIIADQISLPYSHVIDWPSISLTIPESEVDNLDKVLEYVSSTNISIIQKNIWKAENRRALLYSQPILQGDASWQIFDLLARRKQRHEKL